MKTKTISPHSTSTQELPEGFDDPTSWYYVPENRRGAWIEFAAAAERSPSQRALEFVAAEWVGLERANAELEAERSRRNEQRAMDGAMPAATALQQYLGTQAKNRPTSTSDRSAPSQELPERIVFAPILHTIPRFWLQASEMPHPLGVHPQDFVPPVQGLISGSYNEVRQAAIHSLVATYVEDAFAKQLDDRLEDARFAAAYMCPICGQADRVAGGEIRARTLESEGGESINSVESYGTTLRSCRKCFLTARADYIASISQEVIADGSTRQQRVQKSLSERYVPSR